MSNRETVDIPEPLQEWVDEAFGDATKSRAEAYRMALWYARRQYRLETDDAGD